MHQKGTAAQGLFICQVLLFNVLGVMYSVHVPVHVHVQLHNLLWFTEVHVYYYRDIQYMYIYVAWICAICGLHRVKHGSTLCATIHGLSGLYNSQCTEYRFVSNP